MIFKKWLNQNYYYYSMLMMLYRPIPCDDPICNETFKNCTKLLQNLKISQKTAQKCIRIAHFCIINTNCMSLNSNKNVQKCAILIYFCAIFGKFSSFVTSLCNFFAQKCSFIADWVIVWQCLFDIIKQVLN